MNTIISTMKIHNYLIVSNIQILYKKSLKNVDISRNINLNNSYHDGINDSDNNEYYSDDYDNDDYYSERTECDNCNILFLNTLLNNGLCEMCAIKRERKLKIYRRKMK